MSGLIAFPTEASAQAPSVDRLYLTLVVVSALIVLLVASLILIFSVRYRKGSKANRGPLPAFFSREIEVGWTLATLLAFLGIFTWASAARLVRLVPPKGALIIRVVAKQWMWKFEHPTGAREIDTLHVPLGVPVELAMTSQDVIHSFYVPAFRTKQDVLPDRITTEWFTPTRLGDFAIRCAEYCGTDHALMSGTVIVVSPSQYAHWANAHVDRNLMARGASAYNHLGCAGCHNANDNRAPRLAGLYGSRVALSNGHTVLADETYLERSILDPRADIVRGYFPLMPSYRGVATSEELSALVSYLKSLKEVQS